MLSQLILFMLLTYSRGVFLDNLHAPENIAFDEQQKIMYVSDLKGLYSVTPDKKISKLYDGMVNGIAVKDGIVYFAPVTSVMKYEKGKFYALSRGYKMANGLAICGDKLVITDSGIIDIFSSKIDIIDLKNGRKIATIPHLWGANGVTCDRSGKGFYFGQTFIGTIYHVNFDNVENPQKIFSYPGKPPIIDDMTVTADGKLLFADFLKGKIVELDPRTGNYRILIDGLHSPTTVRINHIPEFGKGCMFIAEKGPPAFFGSTIVQICF